ncbi:hypothetical protein HL658_28475 [Azospirillum sp. RWY-5-1]|uniref:GcrA cell cycle regulator n=1 Tax=Azospirillum oleiclasticum TaxID=2735135 RepID=A0ABX2TLP7_9PROT|nr:hypothetical protein [Azospirillum oleiclasticum]NYZ16497.1 hypothetical protein [Azospirillum oleiclasticum]NYZ24034.1 hypothetical protein [Azospirillum oleiclasticum]
MDSLQIGEISRRYRSGQSTSDIARDLRLRSVDVIACIRGLQPPSMATRIARPSAAIPATTIPATTMPAAAPAPAKAEPARTPAARPLRRPAPVPQPVLPEVSGELDDLDEDEPVIRQGCPPGWLVTEAEYHAAFERSGGRFVDAVFKHR